jgi:uncharacterized membrane protein (DUF485 family)
MTPAQRQDGKSFPSGPDESPRPWEAIAASPEFTSLLRRKAAFIVPTCVFFIAYYFALPVLVGFFPDLMKTRIGGINLAYGFALSQFFMVWGIAALYVRVAAKWDKQSAALVAKYTPVAK